MRKAITFLHFSDIHFNKNSNSIYCLDKDVRNEMVLDIEHIVNKEQLQPYGIIVCGDIAYSGQEDEYKCADEFIDELLSKLEIDYEHVFCVPGNHDVDQKVSNKSVPVYAVQKLLETADDNNFHKYLDMLKEQVDGEEEDILFMPLKNYNNFSGKYMGNVSSTEGPWSHEVELNGGYKLCLYGINSTIISNADDHKDKKVLRLMRVGKHQIPMRREKVVYMTVCHHPVDNWKEDISQVLDERVMIQLYGHKHVQTLDNTEKRVRIGTGALQPDRREEGWQPRYNFLSVNIDNTTVEVLLYPRIWDDTKQKFVRDDEVCDAGYEYKRICLPLVNKVTIDDSNEQEAEKREVRETSDNKRKLVYLLWGLNVSKREKVIHSFECFENIRMSNLNSCIEKILKIAEENGLLEEIIKKIEESE